MSFSNCQGEWCCYESASFLGHVLKVVKMVSERRISNVVLVDKMQFYFMAETGIFDAVFICWKGGKEKYGAKENVVYFLC